MKYRKYILLFLLVAFCFTDCKKYPEGPTFSLRTKMARITGVWDVEYYEASGIDSTSYVLSSPCYCQYYFSMNTKQILILSDYAINFMFCFTYMQKHTTYMSLHTFHTT